MRLRGKGGGDNLNRANRALEGLRPKGPEEQAPTAEVPPTEQAPTEVPPTEQAPVEGTPPPTENNIPPVDTPPVESAPPTDVPPVEIPPVSNQPEPPVVTDELVFKKLSETLGRTIKGYDDLKPTEVAQDPELKQLMDWKEKTGLSLSKWSDFNKDFSAMGDLDVAREILLQEYPNFTPDELNYQLQDYIFNDEVDEDGDKLKKSVELKKFAAKGRQTLEQNRLQLQASNPGGSLTQEQQSLIDYATTMKANEQRNQQSQTEYVNSLNNAALSLKSLNLKLGDDVTIDHQIDEVDKKDLSKFVTEMPHWYNEDGSARHEAMALDGYRIKNFEKLINAAFEQGKSFKAEDIIRRGNNITLDQNGAPQGGTEQAKGNVSQVVSKIVGKQKGSKFRFRSSNK